MPVALKGKKVGLAANLIIVLFKMKTQVLLYEFSLFLYFSLIVLAWDRYGKSLVLEHHLYETFAIWDL